MERLKARADKDDRTILDRIVSYQRIVHDLQESEYTRLREALEAFENQRFDIMQRYPSIFEIVQNEDGGAVVYGPDYDVDDTLVTSRLLRAFHEWGNAFFRTESSSLNTRNAETLHEWIMDIDAKRQTTMALVQEAFASSELLSEHRRLFQELLELYSFFTDFNVR
jgi:hypothetical protein